jgi:hypothetical protein
VRALAEPGGIDPVAIHTETHEDGVNEEFGCGRSHIREWIEREEIPTGWGLRFFLLLIRLGYEVDVGGVFQLRDDDCWVGTSKPLRACGAVALH